METTTITAKMHLEEAARKAFQQMQRQEKPKPKKLNLMTCIEKLRAMRKELIEKCADTSQEYIEALEWMIHYITTPSDRTLANMYLLIVGWLLMTLGVVCGAAGCWHAFHGTAQAAIIGKYAAGFFAAGWVCFLGVRK